MQSLLTSYPCLRKAIFCRFRISRNAHVSPSEVSLSPQVAAENYGPVQRIEIPVVGSWGPALSVLVDEIPGILLLSLWNNSSGTESCSLYSIFYFSFDYLISSRFVWRFVDSAYLRHDVQNMKWWLQRWGQQPGFPCNMDSAGSRGANLSSMASPNPNQEPTRYLIGIDCGIHA